MQVASTVMKLLGVTRLFREGLRRQNTDAEANETKDKYRLRRRTFKHVSFFSHEMFNQQLKTSDSNRQYQRNIVYQVFLKSINIPGE